MNTKLKARIEALVLCAVVAASVSCGSAAPDADTTTAEAETSAVAEETTASNLDQNGFLLDDLPELDYGDREFTVFTWNEFLNEINVDEYSGDIVNDAVYDRNRGVEERLGIKFNFIDKPGNYSNMYAFANTVSASILSGSGDIDLVSSYNLIAPSFIMKGVVQDLTKLQYLDFSKPWWPENIIDEMEIDGRVFLTTGDISIGLIKWMYCTYFNKNMITDFSLDDPYELVESGQWTLDKLAKMTADIYADLNGNDTVDAEDRFGLIARANMQLAAFISSCDCPITSRDENGLPTMDFGTERVVNTIDRLVELFKNNAGNEINATRESVDETTFPRGNTLFYMGYVGYAEKLRDVNSFDFGIIPAAKYDEAQEGYKIYVGNEYTFFCVPIDVKDPDLSGAILEALASDSYRNVIPAYYETALKVKYSRDDTTMRMLDMMKSNVDFNFGYIFANNIGNNPAAQFRYTIESLKSGWASTYESNRAVYQKDLDSIIETIRGYAD